MLAFLNYQDTLLTRKNLRTIHIQGGCTWTTLERCQPALLNFFRVSNSITFKFNPVRGKELSDLLIRMDFKGMFSLLGSN
jgi:hypothetical protein